MRVQNLLISELALVNVVILWTIHGGSVSLVFDRPHRVHWVVWNDGAVPLYVDQRVKTDVFSDISFVLWCVQLDGTYDSGGRLGVSEGFIHCMANYSCLSIAWIL